MTELPISPGIAVPGQCPGPLFRFVSVTPSPSGMSIPIAGIWIVPILTYGSVPSFGTGRAAFVVAGTVWRGAATVGASASGATVVTGCAVGGTVSVVVGVVVPA